MIRPSPPGATPSRTNTLALQGSPRGWRVIELHYAPQLELIPLSDWMPHARAINRRGVLLQERGAAE